MFVRLHQLRCKRARAGIIDRIKRFEDYLRVVIITARDEQKIVGIARAISDLAFATYLSDLAVHEAYQGKGSGRHLIQEAHQAAGLETTLYLVSAPAAESYYPAIGMAHVATCWKFPAPR